jgi:crossover junction endodeoxyribonuclease RusA
MTQLPWPASLARALDVEVPGKPRAQGSMTLWRAQDGTERAKYAPEVVAHRNLVIGALVASWAGQAPLAGPVRVRVRLVFPRPRAHYRTGRHASELRPGAPVMHTQYPDLDKCVRLVFDALTVAGVWVDDKQGCDLHADKRWGTTGMTSITLYRKDDSDG